MTIKAGQQTAEANDLNRRYCGSLGGTDATNETDQTIDAGTLNTVVCHPPVDPDPSLNPMTLPDTNRNPFGKN